MSEELQDRPTDAQASESTSEAPRAESQPDEQRDPSGGPVAEEPSRGRESGERSRQDETEAPLVTEEPFRRRETEEPSGSQVTQEPSQPREAEEQGANVPSKAEEAPAPGSVPEPGQAPENAPVESVPAAAAPQENPIVPPSVRPPQRENRGERRDRPPRDKNAPPREQKESSPQAGQREKNRERPAGQEKPTGERGDRGRQDRGPQDRGPQDRGQQGQPDRSARDRKPEIRPRFDGPIEIEFEKLVADSLYLDNQAHVVVSRLRDLDAETRSQLRRLYSAVRRACRAAEGDRQHQFVMLRARLAYTIARHGLRSLDPLERLLLQVTRRNETRGYDRFRDLFEAIIAYNE